MKELKWKIPFYSTNQSTPNDEIFLLPLKGQHDGARALPKDCVMHVIT